MTHKDLGFDIKMDNHIDIFCEYNAGYVFTVNKDNYSNLEKYLKDKKINYLKIGEVTNAELKINSKNLNYSDIMNKYFSNLKK